MSRDVTCPWCRIVCMDQAELCRHIDNEECSVKKLRAIVDRLEDEITSRDESTEMEGT